MSENENIMKNLYIAAWVLLAVAAFTAVLADFLIPVALLLFSLVALGLILSLGLWSVVVQTRDFKTE